jgi:pimeloyl-ACP methyl ester carboxylesterase
MLHIAGGPGGAAYIDSETMPYWLQNFKAQDWGVDFVLYDQRGSGLSQPFLDCPGNQKAQLKSLMMPLTASQDSMRFADQMYLCYESLSKQAGASNHVDIVGTKYSTDDIADLSELLGVDQWVLMGVSYGTRLALEFVERFPDLVHSLVLDSVYPPEFDGFETMLENGFRGVEKLLMACEQDLACDERFPDLVGQLQRSLSLLVKSPMQIRVPRETSSLANQSILLTAHRLIALIDYSSYDSELFAEIPAAIFAVASNEGSNASLLKLASNYLEIELFTQFSEPVFMMTECNENGRFDMKPLRERLQPYIDDYPMLDWSAEGIFNPLVCKGWRQNNNPP